LSLAADISTKRVGNTDAETGKGKLIVRRHPNAIGNSFKLRMAD